ncbi:MAG: release factor glutamine methyltransferase [Candidatus Micrarchaeota archaeon]|nr:MAG: release factor glutamine methyltransferase [Candidatus Micrarchaeota archaeon]
MKILDLDITVYKDVYLPSDDTFLAMDLIKILKRYKRVDIKKVLDIGAGTGVLGLYASTLFSLHELILVDISKEAVRNASYNVSRNLHLLNADRISVIRSDILKSLDKNLNLDKSLIIFNGPYLKRDESSDTLSVEEATQLISPYDKPYMIYRELVDQLIDRSVTDTYLCFIYDSIYRNELLEELDDSCIEIIYICKRYFFEGISASIFLMSSSS